MVLASDGVWDALTAQQISDIIFRNIEEYRLLFDDTKRSSSVTKRLSSKTVLQAARASCSRKSLVSKQNSDRFYPQKKSCTPTIPPTPPVPPPPTRKFRNQRHGMKMVCEKFHDGPLMAAAAEILRTATCTSRSGRIRPSGDDLTCFVIPGNCTSDEFMLRYEKRSKNKKRTSPEKSEPSVETCVRKLVRLGNIVSFGKRNLDRILQTCCEAERLETARYLYTHFGYLFPPFTKQQLAVFPISLPGNVPPVIRGGRLERLKRMCNS